MEKTEAVLVEVSVVATNRNAPLFDEVIRFMKERGFALYDICSFFRRPSDNLLYQMDVIFVRDTSLLLEDRALRF